jgi:hypothetical protein
MRLTPGQLKLGLPANSHFDLDHLVEAADPKELGQTGVEAPNPQCAPRRTDPLIQENQFAQGSGRDIPDIAEV